MATLVTDLGLFPYGSNPTFTTIFTQKDPSGTAVPTDPSTVPDLDLTDGTKQSVTASLSRETDGIYTFQVPGGLLVPGTWKGRAFAGPGNGQASVDFKFKVEQTKNPVTP